MNFLWPEFKKNQRSGPMKAVQWPNGKTSHLFIMKRIIKKRSEMKHSICPKLRIYFIILKKLKIWMSFFKLSCWKNANPRTFLDDMVQTEPSEVKVLALRQRQGLLHHFLISAIPSSSCSSDKRTDLVSCTWGYTITVRGWCYLTSVELISLIKRWMSEVCVWD